MELKYAPVYYRTDERSTKKKVQDIPGWWSGTESKSALLGEYRRCLSGNEYVNRSISAVKECRQYVFLRTGEIIHSRSAIDSRPFGSKG